MNKSEARWHRELYEKRVYPHLLPHQRVAVVPGFFGCAKPDQPGGCEKNFSLLRSRCICAVSGEDLSQVHCGHTHTRAPFLAPFFHASNTSI